MNPLQDWFPAKRGNGVIGLDPLAASAPNSTVFLLPATSAAASLTIGLPPAAKGAHVVCRFDVRIGSIDPVRDIGMVGLTASDPSLKSYEVRVAISTARSYTDERGELTSSNMVSGNIDGQTLPVDSWQTITLDAALQAGKGRLIVRAGSVQLAYLTLHAPVGTFDTLRIGAEPNDTLTGKTEFRFDNVACDVLPPLN